ncbi:MAG: DUF3536 domain-containing protein [Desulfobacterales bacterium]|nr:MAG: DUF3536 domain-containing protein [Desulfobacterales bacterium]
MAERCICIHGHFYQPPRENAWLEAIEVQDSAYPYHDWNARITAECYAANAASRILDDQGRIVQIVNNYAKMSFNFGPTLLAWMEEHAPEVYQAVLAADAQSREHFAGHGSALAQAYNHIILPLANRRDQYTQVYWGIRDFEYRFGRKPEGMWLPETAVNLETLQILAELDIRFTILSPYQARRVRAIGDENWEDVSTGTIDPTMAYSLQLAPDRNMVLFFYDGPISHAVAFERLLRSGELFAKRLLGGFADERVRPQLVHIATDGETYGHHQRFGDMALAYALDYIESNQLAQLTNYGAYLAQHPPTHEVEIFENSSWSCAHGIERWKSDCGCRAGRHPDWNQAWRAPLRQTLDWLRDTLAPAYAERIRQVLKEPWEARNDYIGILLDRAPDNYEQFWSQHVVRSLDATEKIHVLKLLEMQRQTMLMYTSCGWFFDELSGLETVQVIQYAGRALQLATELFGDSLEEPFLERLQEAKSNISAHADGRRIYEKFVQPAVLDLNKVAAHYAISSLFEDYPQQAAIFCFAAAQKGYQKTEAGKTKVAVGRAAITSRITLESAVFHFGVVHLGDHNVACGILADVDEKCHQGLLRDLFQSFNTGDFAEVLQVLDKYFEGSIYSLKSLFRDEQRKIFHLILETAVIEAETTYRNLYENHLPLMRFLKGSGSPIPKALYMAGEVVINSALRREFSREELDHQAIQSLLEEADRTDIALDADTLEYALRHQLERLAELLAERPEQFERLEKLAAGIQLVYALPFDVQLRKVQDRHYQLGQSRLPEFKKKAARGDTGASRWVKRFQALSEKLLIRME